jgi:tetratricopeptide (TPR) repeat protein
MFSVKRMLVWLALVSCSLPAVGQASAQATQGANATAAESEAASPDYAQVRRLSQEGKHDEALAQLRELQTKNPNLKAIDHEFGVIYYKKGDYQQSMISLKKALESDPADREATQLLGLSYYLTGHAAEAIPYLEKVQTWFPRSNVDASYILGTCYIQAKDYDRARHAFATMFSVAPDSSAAYLFTARMLLRQEYDPVAEQYAQKAVALDPRLPLAHFLLGELFLYKSRIEEGIAEFQKELVVNPGHAATYYKLADAYTRIQKWEDAEQLLQRSIWLDATSTGPYILMGKVLLKKGEVELAARTLQHAATMDPNNSITHHLLGQAYRELGRQEDAQRELREAERLHSSSDNSNKAAPDEAK